MTIIQTKNEARDKAIQEAQDIIKLLEPGACVYPDGSYPCGEIVERECYAHHSFPTDIIGKAEKLGVEAFKVIKRNRQNHPDIRFSLLPGETEE